MKSTAACLDIEKQLTPRQLKRAAKGNCYHNAVDTLEEITREGREAVLVHGRPILQGGKYQGMRYGHAWVEVTIRLPGPQGTCHFPLVLCIDGNHPDQEMPQGLYYWGGQIEHEEVKRYTLDEVHEHMNRTGTYGPWEA
jgi:hypothetical protein